jgi:diguanylate cyclase (GGDEF)-like protein
MIVSDVVRALNGDVVPARLTGTGTLTGGALPVDVSFGDGEPLLPVVPAASVARMLLERHLPSLVEDTRRVLELSSRLGRLADEASADSLTGLTNRRVLGRAVGRLRDGDVVVMIDLDRFKQVNDRLGHDGGDQVLRAMAETLKRTVRSGDTVGRYGGDEFVVALGPGAGPEGFLERLRRAWDAARPQPVSFSAGIAPVSGVPGLAVTAADRAMYRAKQAGGNCWRWAEDEDGDLQGLGHEAFNLPVGEDPRLGAFVAFSELVVPDGARQTVETAFRERLGAVDSWPGFRALEVWADTGDPSAYVMVSWWDSSEAFREYMRSEDHRLSHRRIPTGQDRPRPARFRRFRVVAK